MVGVPIPRSKHAPITDVVSGGVTWRRIGVWISHFEVACRLSILSLNVMERVTACKSPAKSETTGDGRRIHFNSPTSNADVVANDFPG